MVAFDKTSFLNIVKGLNNNNVNINIVDIAKSTVHVYIAGIIGGNDETFNNGDSINFGDGVKYTNKTGQALQSIPFVLKVDAVSNKALKVKALINSKLNNAITNELVTSRGGKFIIEFTNKNVIVALNYRVSSLNQINDPTTNKNGILKIDGIEHFPSDGPAGGDDGDIISVNLIMDLSYELNVLKIIEPNNLVSSKPRNIRRNTRTQGDRMLDMKYKNGYLYVLAYVCRGARCDGANRGSASVEGFNFGDDSFRRTEIKIDTNTNRSLFLLKYDNTLGIRNSCLLDGVGCDDIDGNDDPETDMFEKDTFQSLCVTESNVYIAGCFTENKLIIRDSLYKKAKEVNTVPNRPTLLKLNLSLSHSKIKTFNTTTDSRFTSIVCDDSSLYVTGLIDNNTGVGGLPATETQQAGITSICVYKFTHDFKLRKHFYYEYESHPQANATGRVNILGFRAAGTEYCLPTIEINDSSIYVSTLTHVNDGDGARNRGFVIRPEDTVDKVMRNFNFIDSNEITYFTVFKFNRQLKLNLIDMPFGFTNSLVDNDNFFKVNRKLCVTKGSLFCSISLSDDTRMNVLSKKKDTDPYIGFDKLYKTADTNERIQGIMKYSHQSRGY
jgi:hypothetical protein